MTDGGVNATGCVAGIPGVDGRIAAPGIGGVSFGKDGRAGVPAGAREPITNAVAGVARGGRTSSGGVTGRGAGGAGVAARGAAGGGTGVEARGVRRGVGVSNGSGAAAASDSSTARCVTSHPPGAAATATGASVPIGITAPQTEQRARTPPAGTLAGSTRNTD